MAQTQAMVSASVFTSSSPSLRGPLPLGLNRKRMVKSCQRLLAHIAKSDLKEAQKLRPQIIIFPLLDQPLQDALTLINARLALVQL